MMIGMKEYKGMRLFPPREHKNLERILNAWTKTAKAYGFQQYKTPLLDPEELYADKTSEEIMREQTYRFTDRGGRDILLRPEITPGTASMIVELQRKRMLRAPYKVFSIGSVFRYEKEQKGRKREHIQCNIDIFGEPAMWADAEIIEVAFTMLKNAGLQKKDFEIRLNDRSAMNTTLRNLNIQEEVHSDVRRLFDKRDKISAQIFEENLNALTDISLKAIDDALLQEPDTVQKLRNMLLEDIQAVYSPNTVRGFDYYTGIVFEIFAKDKNIAERSVVGGGRYDNLIEIYGGAPLPAVGFGMGDVVLTDCIDTLAAQPESKNTPVIIICSISETMTQHAREIGEIIRKHFPVSYIGTISENKLTDVYKYYEKEEVHFVIAIDENRQIHIRTLHNRKTTTIENISDTIKFIKKEYERISI